MSGDSIGPLLALLEPGELDAALRLLDSLDLAGAEPPEQAARWRAALVARRASLELPPKAPRMTGRPAAGGVAEPVRKQMRGRNR